MFGMSDEPRSNQGRARKGADKCGRPAQPDESAKDEPSVIRCPHCRRIIRLEGPGESGVRACPRCGLVIDGGRLA